MLLLKIIHRVKYFQCFKERKDVNELQQIEMEDKGINMKPNPPSHNLPPGKNDSSKYRPLPVPNSTWQPSEQNQEGDRSYTGLKIISPAKERDTYVKVRTNEDQKYENERPTPPPRRNEGENEENQMLMTPSESKADDIYQEIKGEEYLEPVTIVNNYDNYNYTRILPPKITQDT